MSEAAFKTHYVPNRQHKFRLFFLNSLWWSCLQNLNGIETFWKLFSVEFFKKSQNSQIFSQLVKHHFYHCQCFQIRSQIDSNVRVVSIYGFCVHVQIRKPIRSLLIRRKWPFSISKIFVRVVRLRQISTVYCKWCTISEYWKFNGAVRWRWCTPWRTLGRVLNLKTKTKRNAIRKRSRQISFQHFIVHINWIKSSLALNCIFHRSIRDCLFDCEFILPFILRLIFVFNGKQQQKNQRHWKNMDGVIYLKNKRAIQMQCLEGPREKATCR